VGAGRKLTLSQSLIYSFGNMSSQLLQWSVAMFLLDFYSPPEAQYRLLPIGLVSTIMAVGRFVDAPLEPVVGYWSDRTNTRWGRRIPFMLFCGLPLCVFFVLLWYPPFPPNSMALTIYITAVNTCFFLLITLIFCPYLSMLPEIARSNEERVFVNQLMQIFLFAGTGIVMVLPVFYSPINRHPEMFLIVGALGLVSIYIPVFGIKEKEYTRKDDEEESYGIFQALMWTFTNRAFLLYVASSIFFWIGFQVIMNGLIFVVNVLLGKPDSFMTLVFGMTLISVMVSFVAIYYLTRRYTKKFIYMLSCIIMALIMPLEYFLAYDNFLGLPVLETALAIFFLLGFPMAGILSVGMPFVADIADYDSKITGRRREAIFFGAQGILNKIAISLSYLLTGQLFSIFGYTRENPLGIQLLGPVTGAFLLVGCLIFMFYPLNERTLELEPVFWKRKKLSGGK